uniref:hypothetical protein n=1 Tax=Moritella viscosa TaxID=80854 RepID=UPI00094CDCE3
IYKNIVQGYRTFIGGVISKNYDRKVLIYHKKIVLNYVKSFWELINNQRQFKKISPDKIEQILIQKPNQIKIILRHKLLVERYNNVLRDFLLTYQQSAEILLSVYEVEKNFNHVDLFLPKSLTRQEKENIISDYIDLENCNINYLPIIQNAKKTNNFYISDKIRLKAKRKHQEKSSNFFDEKTNRSLINYGVSISYLDNTYKIKECKLENGVAHYTYSLDYIKNNNQPYCLYLNFKLLFEYVDHQNRINLINKYSQIGVLERIIGLRSKSEYCGGMSFKMSEMTSQAQIFTYSNVLSTLDNSLEKILQFTYNSVFYENYGFAENANLTMPTTNASALEKVRTLAPELESILKQYKLYVEDNHIDFELLQMSSSPSSMKDIPSLNENKYIYLDTNNQEAINSTNLFFSDQTLLAHVEPFREKCYRTFFELLKNENNIYFYNYEEFQTHELNYLLEKNYIFIDQCERIQVSNKNRVLILEDLHENEVASYHHYHAEVQEEVMKMSEEGLIYFDSSLLSKPEQDYFNYCLNKSEFTNGLDLRNSYLHGTQANPSETNLHEQSYLLYLKLLALILLKIEDDLLINKHVANN